MYVCKIIIELIYNLCYINLINEKGLEMEWSVYFQFK